MVGDVRLVLVFVPLVSRGRLYLQDRASKYVVSAQPSSAGWVRTRRGDRHAQNGVELFRGDIAAAIGIEVYFMDQHNLQCR